MSSQRKRRPSGLGTFAGVFIPSVLTILGLILFRRLGYVVGAAGMANALVILALAYAISILTSMSLSAIATNLRVKGGGDYYLISRSLGVEFGGAIGVVLFLAQSVSVAFYLIGFAEAIVGPLSSFVDVGPATVATAATLFLFIFAWLGSDWATRLQYVVMAALASGLLSFFVGGLDRFSAVTFVDSWSGGGTQASGFWVLFALFFPAATGFTQGVSMSGDLADPGKSLPRGTFAAVGVSLLIYLGAVLVFAGALPSGDLTADYEAMAHVAWCPELITVGIVAATLSSALASFLGAPRILQAMAADRVFPLLVPFAKGYGTANNPRRGVLLTLGIALAFIALGGVDFIAPIVSMFFLLSYGLLNYATAFEAKAASPSFRPRFRWFHYRTSMLGALACLGVMLMINPWASALAVVLLFALYQYVQRLGALDRWADSRRDHYFQNVRSNLFAMAKQPVHARNWRPHLLVFSDQPRRRELLVRFASWVEGGAGVTTIVRVLEGTDDPMVGRVEEARKELEADINERELEAFALVVAAPDIESGVQTLIQSYGLGPLRANTILLNWLEHEPGLAGRVDAKTERRYVKPLHAAQRFGVNVIVLDAKEEDWEAVEPVRSWERRIDVWWFDDASSRLMLLLAYLMTRSDDWTHATLRLLVPSRRSTQERSRHELAMEEFRIDAKVELAADRDQLMAKSRDASLVFVPLRFRRRRAVDPFGTPAAELLADLPVVALVAAGEDIALDAEPEEGEVSHAAELSDAAADVRSEATKIEKNVEQASEQAREAHDQVERLRAEIAALTPDDEKAAEKGEKLTAELKKAEGEAAAVDKTVRDGERDLQRLRRRLEVAEKELSQLLGTTPGVKNADNQADKKSDS